ncbi:MAG: prepilin-type N-terminal cleavage/methylation domain-containing protein [Holosporaceae bacterium]|jgi:prepilin-type N-terminal cleavage/methylation domain-containing protein|nr:prepilin-type N-terminal cleavage/methylation domain-containing protein [Holosporaceae bacterium]
MTRQPQNKLKNNFAGFSLIEVAIAIVIIGLITSFTLKGRELIHTAKLRSVIEQINSIRIAVQAFTEKYGSLPGDLANANDMIGPSVENGRGDGVIASGDDAQRFWKHLEASDIIHLEISNGHPTSKIGGSYSISTNVAGYPGTWIILSGGTTDNKRFSGIISQEDAYFIDKNSDTGDPSTGDVITLKASDTAAIGQKYDIKNKNKDCIIMFKIF